MRATSVTFRLQFGSRKDEDAGVFVGFCPVLKLYSQGDTEEEAEAAVVDAATLFIETCYERNILHSALRSRGMVKASRASAESEESNGRQFIHIAGYEHSFSRDVPLDLMAQAENLVACQ